jgi:hypothetical protein
MLLAMDDFRIDVLRGMGKLLLVVPALAGMLCAAAQPTQVGCTLTAAKMDWLVGEPFIPIVTVANKGEAPVKLRELFEVGFPPLKVLVLRPGQTEWRECRRNRPPFLVRWDTLAPREARNVRGYLFASETDRANPDPDNLFVFDAPGVYGFRVELSLPMGEESANRRGLAAGEMVDVLSNAIRISAHAPQGREADAFDVWREGMRRNDYTVPLLILRRDPSILTLLHDHPGSIYTEHVRFFIALGSVVPFEGELHGRSSFEYQRDLLETVLSHGAEFPLLDEVALRLAALHNALGRPYTAKVLLRTVVGVMPDSPVVPKAKEMLPEIEERVSKRQEARK